MNSMPRAFALLCAVITLLNLTSVPVHAQSNGLVPYSGMLTTDSGEPLADGEYQIAFRVYDQVEGGSLLLEESYPVKVDKGRFDVMLGQQKPTVNFADVPELWLEVQIDGQKPFLPRLWFTVSTKEWSLWDELDPQKQDRFADTLRQRIYEGMLRWWPLIEAEHQDIILSYYKQELGILRADAAGVLRMLVDQRNIKAERFAVIDTGVEWTDDTMFDLPEDIEATIPRSNPSSAIEFPFLELCRYLRTDAPLRSKCP